MQNVIEFKAFLFHPATKSNPVFSEKISFWI